MTWFYWVSHPIMTPDASGRSHRPTKKEILEVHDEHSESVTAVCHVAKMSRGTI